MKRIPILLLSLGLIGMIVGGCGGRSKPDPILSLSAEEALAMGKSFLEDKKFAKAHEHLTHAFEIEPNSRNGREALLLAADAFFLDGGEQNFIKCEAKYRDFLNRFPTSDRSDYAQFQVANCLAHRMERPDRDQQVSRKALESFEELLRLYPSSGYAPEARQKILEVTDQLAAHELVVASFYMSYGRGICLATINRLETLRREYPSFSRMDEALFYLVQAYDQCNRRDDADAALAVLRSKYADSKFIERLPKRPPPKDDPPADSDSTGPAVGEDA